MNEDDLRQEVYLEASESAEQTIAELLQDPEESPKSKDIVKEDILYNLKRGRENAVKKAELARRCGIHERGSGRKKRP